MYDSYCQLLGVIIEQMFEEATLSTILDIFQYFLILFYNNIKKYVSKN